MGRPDADPSSFESQQIQTEYELQPQEYEPNHDQATPNVPADHDQYLPPQTYQQDQQYQPNQQQRFQPPPAQQQQPQQHHPNQAYPPPQAPAPYPPHQNLQSMNNPVVYPNRANGTGQQQPPAPAAYPPQPVAVQYPPKSPPTSNQMYANVSPAVMPTNQMYANLTPQAFPQPAYLPTDQGMPPASPHKPGQPPTAVAGIPMRPEGWKTGLFDFMDDPMNALVTAFFPCLTFGQIAEIVDDGHTTCGTSGLLYGAIAFCIGMPCLMSCTYRTKLRNKFGLPEAPAPDWVTHFLCEWCALCQEYRELQLRGWDPSIGWHGNLAKNQMMQQQPVMMAAPINQRMMA